MSPGSVWIVDRWQIKPLHSTITGEEQARVFDRPASGCRKVSTATDRHTYIRTYRHTDMHTQTERQTSTLTDRQTECLTLTDRHLAVER